MCTMVPLRQRREADMEHLSHDMDRHKRASTARIPSTKMTTLAVVRVSMGCH